MQTTVIIDKPHLDVQNLNLHIHDHHVLKNVSLGFPEKKITCILGPSGCGKTTLLRSLNRMHDENKDVKITGGIVFHNQNIYDKSVELTSVRKKMGLLAQRPTVLPMSIYDNVAYGIRLYGNHKKTELNDLVNLYLEDVGLWNEVKDRLKDPANRLSIGQQQRLCLARGLAVNPEIILADESTSALDPTATNKIEELFLKLKEKYTIIVVTHTLRQAKRIADYIAFMYMGELIEYEPAHTILTEPKHELTQEYLDGGSNI